MSKQSAGLVVYKKEAAEIKILLVHPGGPFWKNKDDGSWSIPKGEYNLNEDALTVAVRELEEETGNVLKNKNFIQLTDIKTKAGKKISAWAVEENFSQPFIRSNLIEINWPPKKNRKTTIPEVDRAEYFSLDIAKKKILQSQLQLILEFENLVKENIQRA